EGISGRSSCQGCQGSTVKGRTRMTNFVLRAVLGLALLGALRTTVHADIIVSTGYHDGLGGGGTPVPPNPWLGSANTTFFFNSGLDGPGAADPDMSAILFQNT